MFGAGYEKPADIVGAILVEKMGQSAAVLGVRHRPAPSTNTPSICVATADARRASGHHVVGIVADR